MITESLARVPAYDVQEGRVRPQVRRVYLHDGCPLSYHVSRKAAQRCAAHVESKQRPRLFP